MSGRLVLSITVLVVFQSQDFTPFLDAEFNKKQWINEVLKSAVSDHNVDQKASELVLQLQSQMKDVSRTIEQICQDVVLSIPRVLREVETLKTDAMSLSSELKTMRENVDQVDADNQNVISELVKLDRARRNAQTAANALRETDRWWGLVHGMNDLLESGEVEQVCCNIEGMEQCLNALTQLPDYADRVALVGKHKDSLEGLLAPQLLQALDHLGRSLNELGTKPWSTRSTNESEVTGAVSDAKHLIDLFTRIGRSEAASKYYTNWFKSQVSDCWERATSSDADSDPAAGDPQLQALQNRDRVRNDFQFFRSHSILSDPAWVQRRNLVVHFYNSVLQLFEFQLNAQLFSERSPSVILLSLSESLQAMEEKRTSVMSVVENESNRLEVMAMYLEITMLFCSKFGVALRSHVSGEYDPEKPTDDEDEDGRRKLDIQLTQVLLAPFAGISELFGAYARKQFSDYLGTIKLGNSAPQDFPDALCAVITSSVKLVKEATICCFQDTKGIALPYLLGAIQNYWNSLVAKWSIAVDQIGEKLASKASDFGSDQASGFTIGLQVASITGELSLQSDVLVESILTKSADLLTNVLGNVDSSPLFGSGIFEFETMNRLDSLCSCDWCMLRQLAVCQPAELQNALHRLAHPSASNGTVDPDQKPSARKVPALESTLEFNPTALHRANLSACRSAVSVVRRVALAPLSALLSSVPGLPVWSSNPESGENTLPDLAYLPQDYITKIGQYLLALPEHLEPYMSAGVAPAPYSLLSNKVELFTESDPGRGLAECLHLGDPEITNLPSLSGKVVEDTGTEPGSKSSSQRKRMPSFTLTARRSMSTGIGQPDSDTATSAAFGWLESLVSGSASDLLLTTLLRIGTVERPKTKGQNSKQRHRPQHRTSDQGSESESELEEQAALTEHGAKQLEVDLGYFHNVLDDLGLTFSGSLQAFYELIRCPPDEFATVSAERPPRIVNAVARLRGL